MLNDDLLRHKRQAAFLALAMTDDRVAFASRCRYSLDRLLSAVGALNAAHDHRSVFVGHDSP
jgi:hypothetical protein